MTDSQALGLVLRHCVGPRVHKKVAESVGLNPTAFSQYVNGQRLPRRGNFKKCCKAAGYSEPIVKGAMARIQQVADRGGDDASQLRELERYLAAESDGGAAEPLSPVQDARTQSCLEDLRRLILDDRRSANALLRALEELWAHLAVILRGRTT